MQTQLPHNKLIDIVNKMNTPYMFQFACRLIAIGGLAVYAPLLAYAVAQVTAQGRMLAVKCQLKYALVSQLGEGDGAPCLAHQGGSTGVLRLNGRLNGRLNRKTSV